MQKVGLLSHNASAVSFHNNEPDNPDILTP